MTFFLSLLKAQLPDYFDAVYCSPSLRCKDLATVLAYKNVMLENTMMEMNFGDWDGKAWDDIDQTALNKWMTDFVNVKTPNGENLIELHNRVSSFFDTLRQQPHQKVIIITHAGVIRCVWAYLLSIPLQNIFKIPVGFNEVMVANLKADKQLDSIKQKK